MNKALLLNSPMYSGFTNTPGTLKSKVGQTQSEKQLKKIKQKLSNNFRDGTERSNEKFPISFLQNIPFKVARTESSENKQLKLQAANYFHIKGSHHRNMRKHQSSANAELKSEMQYSKQYLVTEESQAPNSGSTTKKELSQIEKLTKQCQLQGKILPLGVNNNNTNTASSFMQTRQETNASSIVQAASGKRAHTEMTDTTYIEDRANVNCTIYLIYQKQKLIVQFNTQQKTTDWLNQRLVQEIYNFEKDVMENQNIDEQIKNFVGFQSANKNISVSYYLTLKNRTLDIFENAQISLEPIIYDYKLQKENLLNKDYQVNLKDFNLIKCIGLGGFSRVYLVQKKDNGRMYALKLIDKQFIVQNKKEIIVQNERNIMAIISHPFLLKLEYSFESKNYLGFVMEYCAGGELFYHLRRIKRMNEDQARFYFIEICLGIEYLHQRAIIYRDIKPENILLDIEGHIRIGDFGLSKPDMDINEMAYSFCGSPEYMAPEMLLKVGHTYTVDYYCLGALLYELVTGLPPYYSHNTEQIYESILNEDLIFPEHIQLSKELQHLLYGLLTKHPMQRIGSQLGIKEIFMHPWVQKTKMSDILEKKIPTPLKPDILGFNFDEEEFSNGEKEFRKQLLKNQLLNKEEQCQHQIFKDFYFDSNMAKKFRQQFQQQQQQINNIQKICTPVQNQNILSHQQQPMAINQQYYTHSKQQVHTEGSSSQSKDLHQQQIQRNNSPYQKEILNAFKKTQNNSNNNQHSQSPQQIKQPQPSQQQALQLQIQKQLKQKQQQILQQQQQFVQQQQQQQQQLQQIQQQQMAQQQLQKQLQQQQLQQQIQQQAKKPSHQRSANSLSSGLMAMTTSNLGKQQHNKAQSMVKLQTNNFLNNLNQQCSQQGTTTAASNTNNTNNSNIPTPISHKRLKTEESVKSDNDKNDIYFSSAQRVLTEGNRKSNDFSTTKSSTTNIRKNSKGKLQQNFSPTKHLFNSSMKHYTPLGFIQQFFQ